MDNLTHTMTGLLLARAGLRRTAPLATLTLALAANAPDIDVVASSRGTITYLQYHRGYTHALMGLPFIAALTAAVVWLLSRRKKEFRWGRTYLLALLGVGSHALMDYTNVYGVRPWLPFSAAWRSWDIEFIVDPWLWGVMAVCLAGPFLGQLISGEIGARSGSGRSAAIFALVLVAGWWGFRDLNHRRALEMLDAHVYGVNPAASSGSETPERNTVGVPPQRVAAFAVALNPFLWRGVVETETFYQVLDVDVRLPLDPTSGRVLYKPQREPALEAAEQTRTAQEFSKFARYRYAHVDGTGEGWRVVFSDLRFPWRCTIDLDQNLRVLREDFRFR